MENVEDVYALTALQQGLLFHAIEQPGTGIYVDQVSFPIEGDLNVTAFRQAWEGVIVRHTALRASFLWDGLDKPLQVVSEHVVLPWQEVDWLGVSAQEAEQRFAEWLRDDARRGFDPAEAPLSRVCLFHLDSQRWRCLWTFHHLIADGWSSVVVRREVLAAYRAAVSVAPFTPGPAFRYRDYLAWLLAHDDSDGEAFWRQELAGITASTGLCLESAHGQESASDYRQAEGLASMELGAALTAMAASRQVTLNTVVQAAWALLLSRYQHDDDVVFGITMSGRPGELQGVEQGVGLFINTLPLRLQIDPGETLGSWLKRLQQQHFRLLDRQYTPLVDIQRWSGLAPGEALFESILVFENYPSDDTRDDASHIRVGALEVVEHSNYPFALLVVPETPMRLITVYDSARVTAAVGRRVVDQLLMLLSAFIDGPDRTLREFLAAGPHPEPAHLPRPAPAVPAGGAFDMIADAITQFPDQVAVVSDGQRLSYRELGERAGRIASGLREQGLGPGERVGIYADRCVEMVVGIVGILQAGGAYVPMDLRYPEEHIRHVARDASLAVILTPQRFQERLPQVEQTVIVIESLTNAPVRRASVLGARSGGGLPAYVIYTSGSTGTPKGVVVSHDNLCASTLSRIQYYGDRAECFLLLSSFAFDSSVAGLFWTLGTGGCLVLTTEDEQQDVERLSGLIDQHAVTHMLCLPSLYEVILEGAVSDSLASLRTVIVAGEVCSSSVVQRHLQSMPDTALFNEYGPTEGTVWCTVHSVTADDRDGPVPIGRPIAGAEVCLIDQHGHEVSEGVRGELCIAGTGLVAGYLNQADMNGQRFVELPVSGRPARRMYRTGDLAYVREDGRLVFLGRADDQVKIRGFRVELGAVEAAVSDHPRVGNVAVRLSSPALPGRRRQLLAYVTESGVDTGVALERDVLDFLRTRLPNYMLPDRILCLDALPALPNGKVDHRALPEPGPGVAPAGHSVALPGSEDEKTLAEIWRELLGVEAVGVDDDFFALGGDSIVSIQLISRARQAGVHLEPKDLVRYPTIAGLARCAAGRQGPETGSDVAFGEAALLPVQAWFFDQGMTNPAHWNQSALFNVPADLDPAILDRALAHCWRQHDALRARFNCVNGIGKQMIAAPDSPFPGLRVVEQGRETVDAWESLTRQEMLATQSGFDLEQGDLFAAVLFVSGPTVPGQLLIAVHHLVIDAVSWHILEEDIETACGQLLARRGIELPPKTTSLRRWSLHLESWAKSGELSGEIAYWSDVSGPADSGIPGTDRHTGNGTEGTSPTIEVWLDPVRTTSLLTEANTAYQTRTDELLLAAFSAAYGQTSGSEALRIDVERHGRADHFDGIDLSRTVGWFTSVFPVTLPADHDGDHEAAIKRVKQRLRSVPHDGLGYGPLRYQGSGGPSLSAIRQQFPAKILFNYLGRTDPGRRTGRLCRIAGAELGARDLRNPRPHRLEVNARVEGDRLAVGFRFSTDCFAAVAIEGLADTFIDRLETLVDHCLLSSSAGYTPSDFPDVGFTQDELDAFIDDLE